jgi:hypothetical protein
MSINKERHNYWLGLHQERLGTGKTVAQFCRERSIDATSYRHAASRYGFNKGALSEEGTQTKPSFIELTRHSSLSEDKDRCVLEIEYREFKLRLFDEAKPSVLRSTLEVLGGLA